MLTCQNSVAYATVKLLHKNIIVSVLTAKHPSVWNVLALCFIECKLKFANTKCKH